MMEPQFLVWKYMSYMWVECGIEQSEIEAFAARLKNKKMNWSQVENYIYRESLWGFSGYSLLLMIGTISILGILLLPSLLPDMEMKDRYVIAHIQHFEKYKNFYLWNPFCWVCYALGYFMSKRLIGKLEKSFNA